MKLGIIGTGYVGLVTGTCLADVGHQVHCLDVDEKKIAGLNDSISPIYEPGIEKLLKKNIEDGRLFFTSEYSRDFMDVEGVFIAVGTPPGEDGSADLQYVEAVARELGKRIEKDMVVIVKSTVPVGTNDRVEAIINGELEGRGVSHKVTVASNPEFLKEGAAIEDFMKPDRIIVGTDSDSSGPFFEEMYRSFMVSDPGKLIFMDRRSAELTKYAANAMLATRISFMNEMSRLCEEVGANMDSIRIGIGSDPRIGRKFLYAGPGYGGSCFPKDVSAIIQMVKDYKLPGELINHVKAVNDSQKLRMFDKVKHHFGNLSGKKIAIWGLAFKPGTDDVRESPSIDMVKNLVGHGATVRAHDPQGVDNFIRVIGESPSVVYMDSIEETLTGADALVLMTEWREYRSPIWEDVFKKMNDRVVFDLRNQYSFSILSDHGAKYYAVGRPDSSYEA